MTATAEATAVKEAHIPADALRAAVSLASSVIPSKTPKDALKYILLDLRSGDSRVHATDSEVGVNALVADVDCSEPFQVAVLASTLTEVIRDGDDAVVQLSYDGKRLTVKYGNGKFNLPVLPDAAEFPAVTDASDREIDFSVPTEVLAEAFARAAFAVQVDSKNYTLCGVCLDVSDGVHIAATDSKRLSVINISPDQIDATNAKPILPVKALSPIRKLSGATVGVSISDKDVVFKTEFAVVVSRLIEGRFPNWRQVFPGQFNFEVPIVAGPFAQMVRKSQFFTAPDSLAVIFTLTANSLSISATVSDLGNCDLEIPVPFDDYIQIKLNPRYVSDFLSKLGPEEVVTLHINDGESQILLTVGDWKYIVMPMNNDPK